MSDLALLYCGDCCPHCDVSRLVILPVCVSWSGDDDDPIQFTYECPRRHVWSTWMPRTTAIAVARANRDEGVETFRSGRFWQWVVDRKRDPLIEVL